MILFKHAQTEKIIATNYYVYTQDINSDYFFPTRSDSIDYLLMRHPFDRLIDIYLFEIKLNETPMFGYTQSQIPVAKALNHSHPSQIASTTLEEIIINLDKINSYKYPMFLPQTEGIENYNVKRVIKCESDLNILNEDLNVNLIPPNNYLPEYFNISNEMLQIIMNCYQKDFEYGGYTLTE